MHSMPVWIVLCHKDFLDNCKEDTALDYSAYSDCIMIGIPVLTTNSLMKNYITIVGDLGEQFLYTLLLHWVLSIHDEAYKSDAQ